MYFHKVNSNINLLKYYMKDKIDSNKSEQKREEETEMNCLINGIRHSTIKTKLLPYHNMTASYHILSYVVYFFHWVCVR